MPSHKTYDGADKEVYIVLGSRDQFTYLAMRISMSAVVKMCLHEALSTKHCAFEKLHSDVDRGFQGEGSFWG